MKALILSGGTGTRLRPITYTSAKQLIPIANKPILYYVLEDVSSCGIKDVYIVVGDTENEIRNAVGDGSKWGLSVRYIKQEAPLGLAHAVLIAEPYIGKDKFVMYLGDNIIKGGIKMLVEDFRISNGIDCEVLLSKVECPQQFGVVLLEDGKVVKLIEKPKEPISNYALVGVYMFSEKIFEAVKRIKPSHRNELEITDAIQYLIDNNSFVKPHIIDGWWKDTGKLEDLLEANRIILEGIENNISVNTKITNSKIDGRVCIGDNTEISNSVVRGPVIIGKSCKIINSYVGPFTSIYHECNIVDSELEHCIILENVSILGIKRLEDSLLGKNVEISNTDRKPKSFRFMIGDSSKVEL